MPESLKILIADDHEIVRAHTGAAGSGDADFAGGGEIRDDGAQGGGPCGGLLQD